MLQKRQDRSAQNTFCVAMISNVFYPSIGGAQTHTLRLSQKLQKRGVAVFVITRHYKGLKRYEEIEGIPTYRVGQGDSHIAIAALTYIAGTIWLLFHMRRKYNILHCHLMISSMTIGVLARMFTCKPLIINPHRSGRLGDIGYLMYAYPLIGRLRLALARRWGDAFISISHSIRAELRDVGVPDEKIWDIANGVDINRFSPVSIRTRASLRKGLNLPDSPLAVFAGRLVPEKSIDVLLNAWIDVLQHVSNAVLLIIGEGEERSSLEKQAQRLGIYQYVKFVGGCDDIVAYLQASDVFVLPSRAEGLPVALLEAMACGIPCVATNIGGTREVLQDGVTGRLVAVEQADALATGIIEAITLPQRQKWADNAREHVVRHFSLDAVVQQYVQLYKILISRV